MFAVINFENAVLFDALQPAANKRIQASHRGKAQGSRGRVPESPQSHIQRQPQSQYQMHYRSHPALTGKLRPSHRYRISIA